MEICVNQVMSRGTANPWEIVVEQERYTQFELIRLLKNNPTASQKIAFVQDRIDVMEQNYKNHYKIVRAKTKQPSNDLRERKRRNLEISHRVEAAEKILELKKGFKTIGKILDDFLRCEKDDFLKSGVKRAWKIIRENCIHRPRDEVHYSQHGLYTFEQLHEHTNFLAKHWWNLPLLKKSHFKRELNKLPYWKCDGGRPNLYTYYAAVLQFPDYWNDNERCPPFQRGGYRPVCA